MTYTYALRTQGISPAGAAEMLHGEPLSSPVDRTTLMGLAKQARTRVFPSMTAVAAKSTGLKSVGGSMTQRMAEARATMQAQRLEALQDELARIEEEIAYWTAELARLKSRLKALFAERVTARKNGTATPASEASLAKLEDVLEKQMSWLEDQLAALEEQRKALQAELDKHTTTNLELARSQGGVTVGGSVPLAQPALTNPREAAILAELARLEAEIESLKKQIEARFHDLHHPPIPRPPASAGPAAQAQWVEYAKEREQQIMEAIRALQRRLSELQAQYVALLAQL